MSTENYELLYGGGYSIKEYYMESGNPRQMRGASELLNECIFEVKKRLIQKGVKEEHIIIGGATLLAKIPAKIPEAIRSTIVKEAENIFYESCRTANAAFVVVPMEDDYEKTKQCALAAYESRRMAKFIPWEMQDAAGGDMDPKNYRLLLEGEQGRNARIPVRCPRCRLRTPWYESLRNKEDRYLCTACTKREMQSNKSKGKLREQCGDLFAYDIRMDTVSKLADQDGRIALLYADINNLGGYKPSAFEEDKAFHEAIDKRVRSVVYDAIRQALRSPQWERGETVPAKFEIIALAGDDVCLLLPGNAALLTAKLILDHFKAPHDPLTISVSVCVANDTTALTYMEKIVEEGLKKTKRHARLEQQSALCLSFFEKTGQLFPMTAKETEQFFQLLSQTKDSALPPTALHNIAEAGREMKSVEEFSLFMEYYLTRDVVEKHQELLKKIHDHYRDKDSWMDFVTWRHQDIRGGTCSCSE